jgi:DUF1365 family protein
MTARLGGEMTASCVYEGWVRHRRMDAVAHEFRYPLFMMYLDLDELPGLFDGLALWSARRPAPAWFRRSDYLGDSSVPLDVAVRDVVCERSGWRPSGPIRLLTHLRYFGYCFNPVSFYYCFDAAGEHVEAVVAEVTNTPWGERHAYVMRAHPDGAADEDASASASALLRDRFAKRLHVSPFMAMDQTYEWRLTEPGERLLVQIENERARRIVFDATLSLRRRELTAATLRRVLARDPLQTLRISGRIYAHALRLWLKGATVYRNPSGAQIAHPRPRPRPRPR